MDKLLEYPLGNEKVDQSSVNAPDCDDMYDLELEPHPTDQLEEEMNLSAIDLLLSTPISQTARLEP